MTFPRRLVSAMFLLLVVSVSPLHAADEPPVIAPVPASAKPRMLDIIPADAAGAFAIANLQELKRKGDTFIDETKVKVFLRPSQLFDLGLQWINIRQGVDHQAAMALMVVDLKRVGVKGNNLGQLEKTLVLAIPFTDRNAIAANFSLKGSDLRPNTIVKSAKTQQNFDLRGYVAVRGQHLLMSSHDKAIQAVLDGKSLRSSIGKQEQQFLDKSDMLLHLGPRGWGQNWEEVIDAMEKQIQAEDDSPEATLVRQLGQAIRQLKFGVVGARIDGGLSLNVITQFEETGAANKLLTEMAGGPHPSTLRGLPEGNLLAAQAARGDGEKNVAMARALIELLLKNIVDTDQLLSAAQKPQFVGVFSEVWQRLQGSRFAVYQNEDEPKLGLLNMVAILDTADPNKFLTEMQELTSFINSAGLKLSDGTSPGIDRKQVAQLIRDLGSDSFRTRRSATVKLSLVGEPALPLLKEATTSTDREVATRALQLHRRISTAAAARRNDLLKQNLLSRVKPKFAYFANAETRDKSPIDIINVRLSEKEQASAKQLQQLLGPDWAKIRVAAHGKHVVVLFGSDTRLFEKTLQNVKQTKAGLAGNGLLSEFQSRSDAARKVEFHMSLARAQRLVTPPTDKKVAKPATKDELSSMSLTIAPTRIQIDLFVPFSEARLFLKDQGW